jgi:Flp pilus assembly protein TadG
MMWRSSRSQAGGALVEFALVTPLLILLLLGAVELGRYAYFSILVGNAARAGVQYATQNDATAIDTSGIATAAQADGSNPIAPLSVASNTSCECWNGTGTAVSCTGSCASGSHLVKYVSVTVNGTIKPLFAYPFLPAASTVSSTATMRVAQ